MSAGKTFCKTCLGERWITYLVDRPGSPPATHSVPCSVCGPEYRITSTGAMTRIELEEPTAEPGETDDLPDPPKRG